MRVKSAIDAWYGVPVAAAIFVVNFLGVYLALALQLSPFEAAVGCSASLLAALFLLWLLLGAYYELRDDCLYCRIGPFSESIPYEDIAYLALSDNLISSMALSAKKIEIQQHGLHRNREMTMISPKNREVFLAYLKTRCSNLEHVA